MSNLLILRISMSLQCTSPCFTEEIENRGREREREREREKSVCNDKRNNLPTTNDWEGKSNHRSHSWLGDRHNRHNHNKWLNNSNRHETRSRSILTMFSFLHSSFASFWSVTLINSFITSLYPPFISFHCDLQLVTCLSINRVNK